VGVPYIDAEVANAFVGSLGAGLATGDFKAAMTKRAADINARGGVLGRRIQLVFYQIDPSSSPGQYQQAACSAFTNDVKVQYVADLGLGPTFWQCMAKAGVGVINYSQSLLTAKGLSSYPGFLLPNSLALDRLARIQAARFDAMGYFGDRRTAKVGILYYDHPEFAAAERVLEQALAARGITVAARRAMHYVASTSDVGQTSSEANGAVLAFRSAGVTHVLAVEQNAFLTGLFGINADSQQYHPRYGYTSQEPLGNIAANVPERSLRGALFFGWQPVYDVNDIRAVSAAAQRCFASFPGAKKETPNQRATLITACESLDLLKAALEAAGASEGARSLLLGAGRLKGFASNATFDVSFARGRADGVVSARNGKWDSAAGQFVYTSGPRALEQ
jgi:ABC-type branched-subunit amino acid transport system substrate-binding protein